MWDVLGFGVVSVDDLVYVDSYPASDSKAPIRDERRDGGGLAGTALVAAARLGARAAYGGILGDDELSRYTIAQFAQEGVDCSLVKYQPGAGPVHSVIIVDLSNGHRTILYNSARLARPQIEDFAPAIPTCRVLFVDNTLSTFALEAISLAHKHGIQVVADLERVVNGETLEIGRRVDHLIVSSSFAERVTGEQTPSGMLRALASPHHLACVVTTGPDGCWYTTRATGDEVHHYPAFRVQAVDTTGCGDVFHGAYAAAIAYGASIPRAITIATATAGLKATRPGGRNGIPDRATVERFIGEHIQQLRA